MRGQLLQRFRFGCGISAALKRPARCGLLVTVVAMGMAGATAAAGAQQAAQAPFSQSVQATTAAPSTAPAGIAGDDIHRDHSGVAASAMRRR